MDFKPPLIVVAAGGAGARMGGKKPERLLAGQRLIDRMMDFARPQTDALALAVRPGDGDWGTGLPMIYDAHPDIGPISALASAMHAAQAQQRDTVLLLGCDLPFLPADLLPRLSEALKGHAVVLPVSQGRVHPMAALWRVVPDALEAWIKAGGQSMWRFARDMGMAEAVWDQTPDPFTNINDQAALARAEALLKS